MSADCEYQYKLTVNSGKDPRSQQSSATSCFNSFKRSVKRVRQTMELLKLMLVGFCISLMTARAQYQKKVENDKDDRIVFPDQLPQRKQEPEGNRWDNVNDQRLRPDFSPYYSPPCGPPPFGPLPQGPPPHGPQPGCRPPHRHGSSHAPHPPRHNHYHDFGIIYHDMERAADAESYNKTAETEDLNDDFNGRSIVAPGQYPHMAALGYRSASTGKIEYKCGGSLISEYFVLTAAHCLITHGSAPDVVKIGDIKLKEWEDNVSPQRRRVSQVHLHPLYNSSYYYHDIGLVQLDGAIEYTWFVRPVRLWVRNEIPYEKLHSMGYGATGFAQAPTNVLTELELSEVPQQQCNSALPFDESAPKGIIDSQICAHDYEKNRDTCQGDSGGPLQLNLERRKRRHRHKRRYRYYLVGITSYGTFCRSEHPGVYTRVSSYVDWITSIVWPDYYSEFDKTTQVL